MATRSVVRSLCSTKQAFSSILSRSFCSFPQFTPPSSLSSFATSSLLRLRPLIAVGANLRHLSQSSTFVRGFATRHTSNSLNDPNPNWSNRPPKETILLDGCDFEHWLVVMEKPEGEPTRDEIIDSYIKTLAKVVGSEEEARFKIYSVSTRHYFAFGALVSEELSYKLKELPGVRWVLPDSYLDVRNKDYGGEPFINGQAVPYDPKYHEEWVRNNARAHERNKRNDRPRNNDRSRSFERRRENFQNRNSYNPGSSNMGGGAPSSNMGPPPNMGGGAPPNMGPPNMGGAPSNMGPPSMGGSSPNMGPPSMGGSSPNMGPPSMGGVPPNNQGGMQQPNMGGMHPNVGGRPNMGGMPPNMSGNMGGMQPNMGGNMGGAPNMGGVPPNMGGMPNNAPNYQYRNGPNNGGIPYQSGPGPNREYQPNNTANVNPYSTQNMPARDMPPPPPTPTTYSQ